MQYELRTQVIEPPRKTFDHLVRRYGDRPASRYEEGTIDIQAKENFHYRPLWDPTHEIYDEAYSAFRLTDAYSFTDPRQFYYAPYVTSRAAMADAVGRCGRLRFVWVGDGAQRAEYEEELVFRGLRSAWPARSLTRGRWPRSRCNAKGLCSSCWPTSPPRVCACTPAT